MNLRSLSIFVTVFLACADSPVVETNLNQIIVWSVLSPRYERQTVRLDQGLNIIYVDGLSEDEFSNPIRDATVLVKNGENEVLLPETAPGVYQDIDKPLDIEPGRTYHLEVTDGSGRVARAHTTVPGVFEIESPSNGAAVSVLDSLVFRWQASSHAQRYEVGAVFEPPCTSTDREEYAFFAATRDTLVSLRARDWCPFDSSRIEFRVLAYDTAAATFRSSFFDRLEIFSNVEGGKGIFGSLNWQSVDVFIKTNDDDR